MTRPLGIGVIGMGVMGFTHAMEYAGNAKAVLRAVADISAESVGRAIERFGVAGYTDYQKLLEREDIDAVSICTSDDAHVLPTLAALSSGKHVLLEKPVATSIEDADTIVQAAAASAPKLMMGHTLRFSTRYQKAKELVSGGAIGSVQSIFARRTNVIGSRTRLKERVSVLTFLGVHDFDIMRWVAGSEVVRVYCEAADTPPDAGPGWGKDDVTFTTLRFASGAIGCAEFGWILPPNHPSGHDFRLDVTGSNGCLTLDESTDGLSVVGPAGHSQPAVTARTAATVGAFLDCILRDTPPPVTANDGRAALLIALAAMESAATGRPVSL